MGDPYSTTVTLDAPPAHWLERDEAEVVRWRRVGRRQADHPEGHRFEPLHCPRCGSPRILVISLEYEGWLNGNSEGTVEYVCLQCEAYTRYAYRD